MLKKNNIFFGAFRADVVSKVNQAFQEPWASR